MPRRRYSDDDDDDRQYSKKRRLSDSTSVEERLENLISRVADQSSSSLESNLEGLSSVLEADLSNYKGKIIKMLCDCVYKYPDKVSIYSTLVGLLNAKNYSFGGEFIEALLRSLKEMLTACNFTAARYAVRFVSDLVNCRVITAGSLIALYENFIEVSLEDDVPQVRSDWYVYAVMSSLPWVARELCEKKESDFNRLFNSVRHYVDKRQKAHVEALRVWSAAEPHLQEDYIDCLWAQLLHMQRSNWTERVLHRPYLLFESVLCDALQHTLPVVKPPPHSDSSVYPFPTIIFRMFDYTDVADEKTILPGSHSMGRFLLEEQLDYIINDHAIERKQCAANLLSYRDERIPLNYMIVEVCFGQLFRLPSPPSPEIFYASLFIELCKLQPSTMPIVLAQATEMLFARLDTMATPCIERFVRWLSHHLSNFQFRWSWDDWKDVVNMDPLLPKPTFVRELLLKCQWLSYHQRLKEEIPADLQPIVPTKPDPQYKYGSDPELPGNALAAKMVAAIKERATPEDLLAMLEELPKPISDDGSVLSYNPFAIDVFTQTLLNMGSKSFSHSFAAVAKFHSVFKALAESEEGQMCVLKATHELWRHHHQMMIVMVNKMLRTQIVNCSAIANWIFSDEMKPDFTCFYVWDILHGTIKKMSKHVQKLKHDLAQTRERKEIHERKMQDGTDNDDKVPTDDMIEEMEEKLEAAEGELKKIFLIVFQRFIIALGNHISACESEGTAVFTPWYKWVSERLMQVFMQHQEQVNQYITTLENLLFTTELDPNILRSFQLFKALRC